MADANYESVELLLSIREKATRKERLSSLRELFKRLSFIRAEGLPNMAKQVSSLISFLPSRLWPSDL